MPPAIAGVVIAGVGAIISGIQGNKAQKAAQKEAKRQRALAQEQLNFAKEQWDYYLDTYGDITNLMVADAMQTEVGDYQGIADRASVDIADRFEQQRDASDRQLFAYGLDPSSGRYMSQNRSLGAQEALSSTLVQNQARQAEQQRVEQLNMQKRQNVGMFGQQQMNRGDEIYTQALQNMQNVAGGNFAYQAGLANNLFANAGEFTGMGLGIGLNQWGKQQQPNAQQQPQGTGALGMGSRPIGGLQQGLSVGQMANPNLNAGYAPTAFQLSYADPYNV